MKRHFLFDVWARGSVSLVMAFVLFTMGRFVLQIDSLAKSTIGPAIWLIPIAALLVVLWGTVMAWRTVEIVIVRQAIQINFSLFGVTLLCKSYALNLFDNVRAFSSPRYMVVSLLGSANELVVLRTISPLRAKTFARELANQTGFPLRDHLP